ncbi:MAG: aminotransferase class III-fold pyridoxal phosphate-dependent enzyme [Planctomycetota bacterium]
MSDPTPELLARGDAVLMDNYARNRDAVMVRGQGATLTDAAGKTYIDLFAGFGGAVLGHCQSDLVEAVQQQAATLWHVGNSFHTLPQIELGEMLAKHAFDGRAFFCHGGADANETAVKAARLYGHRDGGKRWKVIVLSRAFHGRTLAMIAANSSDATRAGFEPTIPGFVRHDPDDLASLESVIDDETAAIMFEPTQGEGGVWPISPEDARHVRELCDKHGILMICDEVWVCFRTGWWFGHQRFDGVEPDLLTLGKAIGGGLPVGVCWAKPHVAELMVPGKHGSTLGGNPICATAAATVMKVIERDGLVDRARTLGDQLKQRLAEFPGVTEVRGHGLFLGLELESSPADFAVQCVRAGVIANRTGTGVIRLAPPINIETDELEQGLDRLKGVLEGLHR